MIQSKLHPLFIAQDEDGDENVEETTEEGGSKEDTDGDDTDKEESSSDESDGESGEEM